MTLTFSNQSVNDVAKKPLNQENWNEFVKSLRSTCVELPACYDWMKTQPLEAEEFYSGLISDIAIYLSDGNFSDAILMSPIVMVLVSFSILSKSTVADFVEKIFLIKK